MKKFFVSKSVRLRGSSFTSRIEKQGVKSYTVYNHMLLPTTFSSPEDEYKHLKTHVQIWDVSVQREIEITGKEAYELVQLMSCRDLSKAKIGSCYYAPLVDSNGGLINDPLIYKLNDEKWRVCIADSDVLLFAKGIAESKNMNVNILEAEIDVLAVQGPKSFDLMKKIFGKKINDLKFFKYDFFSFKDYEFLVSRSGYSKQGGFEIHIDNIKAGLRLYDYFFEIGDEFDLKPGTPNHPERIEGGLLSYGNDMDLSDNPYECGFDKYVNLDSNVTFLGKESLKKIKDKGINRKLMGVKINTKSMEIHNKIPIFSLKNDLIGNLRSAAYSPKFDKIVGIAMVNKDFWEAGKKFNIRTNDELIQGEICNLPIV